MNTDRGENSYFYFEMFSLRAQGFLYKKKHLKLAFDFRCFFIFLVSKYITSKHNNNIPIKLLNESLSHYRQVKEKRLAGRGNIGRFLLIYDIFFADALFNLFN